MVKIVKKVETLLLRFLLPPHRKIRHQKHFSSPYFKEEFSLTPFNAIWKTRKINKSWATHWGWTFATWKLFAFFIFVFMLSKIWKKKKKPSMCFNEIIWLLIMDINRLRSRIGHKYTTSKHVSVWWCLYILNNTYANHEAQIIKQH